MPTDPLEDTLDNLRVRSQAELLRFLSTDLDLAFTMLRTAAIDVEVDPDHCQAILGKVRAALRTIRQLEEHIQDATARRDVHARADQLESDLAAFER